MPNKSQVIKLMPDQKDTKKLHKGFAARVRKENANFARATDAERRVIIAKDVLNHLRVGLVSTGMGAGYGYFEPTRERNSRCSVQKWLREDAIVCEACVRGTLVYSTVLRCGGVRGSELRGDVIPKEFTERMMLEIEAAFESSSDFLFSNPLDAYWKEFDVPVLERLAEWHSVWVGKSGENTDACGIYHWKSRRIRMTAIMQWIVDHDGEFSIVDFLRTMAETDAIEVAIREVEAVEP